MALGRLFFMVQDLSHENWRNGMGIPDFFYSIAYTCAWMDGHG